VADGRVILDHQYGPRARAACRIAAHAL
jgi:hypothetical protein